MDPFAVSVVVEFVLIVIAMIVLTVFGISADVKLGRDQAALRTRIEALSQALEFERTAKTQDLATLKLALERSVESLLEATGETRRLRETLAAAKARFYSHSNERNFSPAE